MVQKELSICQSLKDTTCKFELAVHPYLKFCCWFHNLQHILSCSPVAISTRAPISTLSNWDEATIGTHSTTRCSWTCHLTRMFSRGFWGLIGGEHGCHANDILPHHQSQLTYTRITTISVFDNSTTSPTTTSQLRRVQVSLKFSLRFLIALFILSITILRIVYIFSSCLFEVIHSKFLQLYEQSNWHISSRRKDSSPAREGSRQGSDCTRRLFARGTTCQCRTDTES